MNIFISWSGDVSKNMAESLRRWIPLFFEDVEVFFSPEDIEKGQNWNKRLTKELADCNYGIVCLTSENKSAPWINYEAGAIAKAFDSRVTALLVDVYPIDIHGPLSMFQATELTKDDIYKLLRSINNCLEHSRNEEKLKDIFENLWDKMDADFKGIVANISSKDEKAGQNEILESILQEIREQSRFLSNSENILPRKYLYKIVRETIVFDKDDKASVNFTIKYSYVEIYFSNIHKYDADKIKSMFCDEHKKVENIAPIHVRINEDPRIVFFYNEYMKCKDLIDEFINENIGPIVHIDSSLTFRQ